MEKAYVVRNVEKVLKEKDINLLTNATYDFLHIYMGFPSHIDIKRFKHVYADLGLFVNDLYKLHYYPHTDIALIADGLSTRQDLLMLYGKDILEERIRIMRAIRDLGQCFEAEIQAYELAKQNTREIKELHRLAEKHHFTLTQVQTQG